MNARAAAALQWLGKAAALLALALAAQGSAWAQPTRLGLLVPDVNNVASPALQAWLDGAREQGYEIQPYGNAQLLADVATPAALPRGLIVPDEVQQRMSEELVAALKQYVVAGGRLMLVYDAGVLDANGFYPVPRSRFSDIVGVEYALYDELRDRTIGLGPATGALKTLRGLLVPPGKSMPYTAQLTSTSVLASSTNPTYLQISPSDPTGLKTYRHDAVTEKPIKPKAGSGGKKLKSDATQELAAVAGASKVKPQPSNGSTDADDVYLNAVEPAVDSVHGVVGYGYGLLSYPSFVTRGDFDGTPLLASPLHGLVAGLRAWGPAGGKVMFVNLPLSYLKRQTDGMLLHGFTDYFARRVVGLPSMAGTPAGVGGLVFNWHLDNLEAQVPTQKLLQAGVFKRGPFSIHMTAGPDTVTYGDGLGWNLPVNTVAQGLLREFDRLGHSVGNHGGWIHDYYGSNASETNGDTFTQYLVLNDDAVRAALGHATTDYSAPEGNNPQWAIDWLQDHGVRAYYFLGHTGMGPTRSWRGGILRNPTLWAVPLQTYGSTATFEEWQELGMPKEEIQSWHTALVAFAKNKQGVRQIYAHPPGAFEWKDVLNSLLTLADKGTKDGTFRWYSQTGIADHMTRRLAVQWSTLPLTGNGIELQASHAVDLNQITWLFKKAWFAKPTIASGNAVVGENATDWVVRAGAGQQLRIRTVKLQP